jgi:hypothetical protein
MGFELKVASLAVSGRKVAQGAATFFHRTGQHVYDG